MIFAPLRNSRGQALVQVLVAAGIGAIIMAAIASMQTNQGRENRAMSEKLAANDFQNQMLRSLLDGSVCTSVLNGKTFDSTNAVSGNANQPSINIPVSSIPISTDPGAPDLATAGDLVSAISTSLRINAAAANPFRVVDLVGSVNGANVGTFTGSFQIAFNQTGLIRPIKPASTRVILKTTAAGSTQTVTGCTTIMDNTCWVSGPSGLTTVACGNVGIGTNAPTATLHVTGTNIAIDRPLTPGGGPAYDFFEGPVHAAQLVATRSGVDGSQLGFYTKTSGSPLNLGAPKMVITDQGLVGIGTAPRSTLEVNGYIQIITESISAPNPNDCNQAAHTGRMVIYTPVANVHRICFCPQNIGGGPFRWWCTPTAVLP